MAGPWQMLPVPGPGQPAWSYQQSIACGSLCWAWVYAEGTRVHPMAGFYQHQAWECVGCLRALRDPPLLLGSITDIASSCTLQRPGINSTGWGNRDSWRWGIASPQADVAQMGVLCLRKMASAVWGMTQHRDPGGYSSALSPEPPTPDSPHTSLVHSAHPLLEPRICGCKWYFVNWPFKRLYASLAISPWQTETLLLLTAGGYGFPFLVLVLQAGEPSLGVEIQNF